MKMPPTAVVVSILLLGVGVLTAARPPAPYVVGGKEAEVGAWPWMASIRSDGVHMCGGVLIKPNVVLTAASCATRAARGKATVILGMHSQMNGKLGKPEVIRVSHFFVNAAWSEESRDADIAGAMLTANATIGRFIQPIGLSQKDFDITDRTCTVTGWGATDREGECSQAERLRQNDLVGWTTDDCQPYTPTASNKLRCAAVTEQLPYGGMCQYDAGGPLACPVGSGYVLAGINLWTRAETCLDEGPAIFTYVPEYRDWIRTRLLEGSILAKQHRGLIHNSERSKN